MTARRKRPSGVEQGRLLYAASRGDREARAELDAIEAERAAEQADSSPEQPRRLKPDPSQGSRGVPIEGTSSVDAGRRMFVERGRMPSHAAF